MKTEYRFAAGMIMGLLMAIYVFLIPAPSLFLFSHYVMVITIAALTVAGVFLAIPAQITLLDELKRAAKAAGLSAEEIAAIITTGVNKVDHIREMNQTVMDTRINLDIQKIITVAEKIFEDFKRDPNDIRDARQFLNTYLDTTVELVQKYVKLQDRQGEDAQAVKKKFRDSLAQIEELFETQYEKLVSDEVFEFDVELDVFKNIMKYEEGIKS
jgi:5-bromo-4-chloroindolyl phosphate hydrolysis protein